MKRLDELDLEILDELVANAGSSIPKLAKKLGVKQSKVYSRVKRLMRKGIIRRMTIEANEETLGLNVRAFVGINVESLERDKAAEEITKIPEVVFVSEVTGRFDMIIEVHVRNLEDLYNVVSKKIAILPGVSHTETFIQLRKRASLRKFSAMGR
jgi:Lrp/AsnC family transcriptional regulator for asnA, asnC and gidA